MNAINGSIFLILSTLFSATSTASSSQETASIRTRRPTCKMSEFESCLLKIKSVMESDDLAFASNWLQLNSACKRLQEGVWCADDHMKRCVSRSQKRVFEEVVQGTRDTISRLCVPGPVQRDYLRFSTCYKEVAKSEAKCGLMLRKLQEMDIQMSHSDQPSIEKDLQRFCCSFSQAYECQVHHMRLDQEKCGSEAVKFFETNIETISNSLIHRHCTNFAFRCNSFASSPIDSPTDQMNSQKLHPLTSAADAASIASFMASSVLALLSSLFTLTSLFCHLEYK